MKNRLKNIVLWTTLVAGAAGLNTACSDQTYNNFPLANGKSISVIERDSWHHGVRDSREYPGSKTFFPEDRSQCTSLSYFSRIEGTVEYIGPVLSDKENPQVVHQVAVAGPGILAGGDASNSYTSEKNIVMRINSDIGIRLLYVKPGKDKIPPGVLREQFKVGDKVSVPTVREFDYPRCRFRTLRNIDNYFVNEIKTVASEKTE